MKKLVLIGGGHAHALVLEKMIKQPIKKVNVYLIDIHEKAPYTGMLPGFAAGHYTDSELYIDLKKLAEKAGVIFIQATVTGIDVKTKVVYLDNEQSLDYDLVSFDIGIHARDFTVEGLAENAIPVKPLGGFVRAWQDFLSTKKSMTNLVVVGGGIGAVEMALAVQHASQAKVTIVTRGALLSKSSKSVRDYLRKTLINKGVKVLENMVIKKVGARNIKLKNGTEISSDFTLSAVGARPYDWLKKTDLQLSNGYIVINKYLESPAYPDVFAVGDCAHFKDSPLPKAGVYAVRQAPILYKNLKARIEYKPLRSFLPQKDYLKLITLGEKKACADKFGFCLSGRWLWWLKNKIDKNFMRKFSD